MLIVLLFVRIAMVTELNLISARAMWYVERRHGLYTCLDFFIAFEVVSCINSFLYAIFMYGIVWLIGSWDFAEWRQLPMLFLVMLIPLQVRRTAQASESGPSLPSLAKLCRRDLLLKDLTAPLFVFAFVRRLWLILAASNRLERL